MESQPLPQPRGPRFTRVRFALDGLPAGTAFHLRKDVGLGGVADLAQPLPPTPVSFAVVVERSQDGVDWVAAGGAHEVHLG